MTMVTLASCADPGNDSASTDDAEDMSNHSPDTLADGPDSEDVRLNPCLTVLGNVAKCSDTSGGGPPSCAMPQPDGTFLRVDVAEEEAIAPDGLCREWYESDDYTMPEADFSCVATTTDCDDDGVPNATELMGAALQPDLGGDALHSSLYSSFYRADTDGDGVNDSEERARGTYPADPLDPGCVDSDGSCPDDAPYYRDGEAVWLEIQSVASAPHVRPRGIYPFPYDGDALAFHTSAGWGVEPSLSNAWDGLDTAFGTVGIDLHGTVLDDVASDLLEAYVHSADSRLLLRIDNLPGADADGEASNGAEALDLQATSSGARLSLHRASRAEATWTAEAALSEPLPTVVGPNHFAIPHIRARGGNLDVSVDAPSGAHVVAQALREAFPDGLTVRISDLRILAAVDNDGNGGIQTVAGVENAIVRGAVSTQVLLDILDVSFRRCVDERDRPAGGLFTLVEQGTRNVVSCAVQDELEQLRYDSAGLDGACADFGSAFDELCEYGVDELIGPGTVDTDEDGLPDAHAFAFVLALGTNNDVIDQEK